MDSSHETVIFLGGGKSQLEYIRQAIDLNYYCIVFDQNIACSSRLLADEFYPIGFHQPELILRKILQTQSSRTISGIFCSSSSHLALNTLFHIKTKLGLPTDSFQTLETTNDKTKLYQQLSDAGLNTPHIYTDFSSNNLSTIKQESEHFIVKPRDGSGSIGIQLMNAEGISKEKKNKLNFMCEEKVAVQYLQGKEYSIDGLVYDGQLYIFGISRKFNAGPENNFLNLGYCLLPESENLNTQYTRFYQITEATLKSLQINHSAFSLDVIASGDKLYIIDCGLTLDSKIDRLLEFSGFPIFKTLLLSTLQKLACPEPNRTKKYHQLHFIYPKGRKAFTPETTEICSSSYISGWEAENGSSLGPPESTRNILGWLLSSSDSCIAQYSNLSEIKELQYLENDFFIGDWSKKNA